MDWGKFLFYAQYILPGLAILLCCCFIKWFVQGPDSYAQRLRRHQHGREPSGSSAPPISFQPLHSPLHDVPVVVIDETGEVPLQDLPNGQQQQQQHEAAFELIPVAVRASRRSRGHSLVMTRITMPYTQLQTRNHGVVVAHDQQS
jgi:hypothetical protein